MKNLVFLTQSDTTAGFLSTDKNKLAQIKQRSALKPILKEAASIESIKNISRIPRAISRHIRRKNKTTFIFPNNESFRVVRDSKHLRFLNKFHILYSTSANKSKENFDLNFAKNNADIIVLDSRGIFADSPSEIFSIKKHKIRKIR